MIARRWLFWLILSVGLWLKSGTVARACIGDKFDSVHFNSGEPDFGSLPRRGQLYDEPTSRSIRNQWSGFTPTECTDLVEGDDSPSARVMRPAESEARSRAHDLEAHGDWRSAANEYRLIGVGTHWTGDLRDRVEALNEQAVPGRSISADTLRNYLAALDDVQATYAEKWASARKTFAGIAADGKAGYLRSHAGYQIGCIDAGWFDYKKAVGEFQQTLRDFPTTVKREEILIMIARCAILPDHAASRSDAAGAEALRTLRREYPNSRFATSARGLQARIDYIAGRYPQALSAYNALGDSDSVRAVLKMQDVKPPYELLLCAYLRQIGMAQNYRHYATAIFGARNAIAAMTPADADRFVVAMRHDPEGLAAPYFYFRLYHCENKPRDLVRLARLARTFETSAMHLSPTVQVRLAEVFYQSGMYDDALRWARAAQTNASPDAAIDRAIYVEGASLAKQNRFDAARGKFEEILRSFPFSTLRTASHENLAIVAERQGDLATALDQYFCLQYQADIAFILDIRMSTKQVAAYVASRPHHVDRSLLVYSLGMRQLRDDDWDGARRSLSALPRDEYVRLWQPKTDGGWGGNYDAAQPSPLKTIDDLSKLKRLADLAPTRAAKATALFHFARYYYDHSTLLLYNDALWRGDRAVDFGFWWNGAINQRADGQAAHRHMYEHETYARAEKICEEIATDYPETPTAPYALYRAGCCESALSGFNPWWRYDCRIVNHDQRASHFMAELCQKYPHCALIHEARKFMGVFQIDADGVKKEEEAESESGKLDSDGYSRNIDVM